MTSTDQSTGQGERGRAHSGTAPERWAEVDPGLDDAQVTYLHGRMELLHGTFTGRRRTLRIDSMRTDYGVAVSWVEGATRTSALIAAGVTALVAVGVMVFPGAGVLVQVAGLLGAIASIVFLCRGVFRHPCAWTLALPTNSPVVDPLLGILANHESFDQRHVVTSVLRGEPAAAGVIGASLFERMRSGVRNGA